MQKLPSRKGLARLLFCLPAAALTVPTPSSAQNLKDLVFTTVTPCTIADTRGAGGPFAANETRTFNVVGSASLASQGGSATGCGIPGFSNGVAQAQAVVLTITIVNQTGAGHLAASAADQSPVASVLNYNTPGASAVANTTTIALRQTPGPGDIKILTAVSGGHVVISVAGYYRKLVQTVWVSPVPGDATASGTALRNAVNAITTASATQRFVVKVEPGIYDLGANRLAMKPFVDVEGSGQQATVIRGAGGSSYLDGVVLGANDSELRDLQVQCMAAGTSHAIAIYNGLAAGRFTDLTVTTSGGTSNWGFRNLSASAILKRVTVEVTGGQSSYGIANVGLSASARPVISDSKITVLNALDGTGIYNDDLVIPDLVEGTTVSVSGGSTARGFAYFSFGSGGSLTGSSRITGSTFTVQGSSQSYGISSEIGPGLTLEVDDTRIRASGGTSRGFVANFGPVTIDRSEIAGATTSLEANFSALVGASLLDGPVSSFAATCAASYNGSRTPLNNLCL